MKFWASIISTIFLLSSCFTGEELPPDQEVWEYALPSDVGMQDGELLSINDGIRSGSFQSVRSMIIIKDGKLVFENYYFGDSRSTLRSLGRSSPIVVILALGIAIEEGLIGGLNTSIRDVLPIQYDDIFGAEPLKRQITIEQLLLNRSGLSWNEGVRNLNDPGNDVNSIRFSQEWVRFILEKPLEANPGTRFNLNSMNSLIISKVIEEASGQSFADYVEEKLFRPLGINNYLWEEDPAGNINSGTGLSITPIELTKIAFLYLNEGLWEGDRIVSEDWIERAVTEQVEITNTINYGYLWHLFADTINFPLLEPNDTYFFPQHVFINPSKNLIITFSTDNLNLPTFGPPMFLYSEVISPLIE